MTNTQITFSDTHPNQARFFAELRKRVNGYFKDNGLSRYGNSEMVLKSVILLSGYILPFVAILSLQPGFAVSMILWLIMGICLAGIGMSVMHDANHNSYSSKRWINEMMGYTLNLLGGAVFNWKLQHNLLHHTYTNIVSKDDDIKDKGPLRFSPHTNVKWFHKLQVIYALPFYAMLTLYWVFFKDFVQFSKYTNEGVNKNTPAQNRIVLLKMIVSKVIYLSMFFVLPVVIPGIPFLEIMWGFLLMHAVAGIILTVVFQLAHTVEGTDHPMPTDKGTIENNWAVHQLNTTVNFSTGNKIISWYVGGLNFQVEHHLFPSMCHVHYSRIAPIVRETAKEFGLNYMENKTLWSAIQSHFRTLSRFGKLPDMNEAIV